MLPTGEGWADPVIGLEFKIGVISAVGVELADEPAGYESATIGSPVEPVMGGRLHGRVQVDERFDLQLHRSNDLRRVQTVGTDGRCFFF